MKTFIKFFSNKIVLFISLALLLLIAGILGILIGSVDLSIKDIFSSIFSGDSTSVAYRIVVYVRLPRVISAILAGSALALAGAVLQSILDNSLASPGIIGINAGSGMMYLVALALFPTSLIASSIGAFLGAFIAVIMVWLIATKTGGAKNTIILAGVAISSLFTAIVDTIVTIKPDLQIDKLAFSIGGFQNADYTTILYMLPLFAIGFILALVLSYDLNVLSLGDDLASGLGMRTKLIRFLAILAVALLAGSAITLSGLLGFVGLVSPHVVKRIVGKDNRIVLPMSAFFGAILTLVCDILARTLFTPYEIPVGIILSFIGVPFFLALLFRRKRPNVGGAK